ncbi:MAG TPA: hypothetical protein DCR63_00765 [Microbacterium sp.]|nr:hypothetical protein [Microbacterium sp.]
MKAVLGDTILAEAPREELLSIEGNWYFPPSRVNFEHVSLSPTPYSCPLKGACQYMTVRDGDLVLEDRAWSYPEPLPASVKRFGEFANYVAFWKEVRVTD